MERFFNTAGPCDPERHYMLSPESRLPNLRRLIDRHLYFVAHAPRQSGKTTAFRALAESLTAEGLYAGLHASCETGAGDDVGKTVDAILWSIQRAASESLPEALRPGPTDDLAATPAQNRLAEYLARWARRSERPIVLFLDEIDALRDEALLSVLRQLRSQYPSRPRHFPASLALVGLRDVRDYRIRARPDSETLGTSSPFNIKVESVTLRNFEAAEVAELLAQHTEATGQAFEREALERAHALTGGQPWLVNALALQAIELTSDPAVTVTVECLERAKEALILRRDTHLDSLVDRLREPRVRRVIEPILAGELPAEDVYDDDVRFALDLGLVTMGAAGLEIANPIYREVIPRALTSVTEAFLPITRSPYFTSEGDLDVDRLLDGFREFWCEHAEHFLDRQPYSEAAAQLIFMAFLQRIVNGGGFVDREYGVGRGRIDLCVRWPREDGSIDRWAVELKVWRSGRPDPQDKGVEQLTSYLERLGLETGTLIVFDRREEAPPPTEGARKLEIEHAGRRLTVLRL